MKQIIIGLAVLCVVACSSEQEEPSVNCASYGLQLNVVTTTDANCGKDDGFISVQATGGDGNYTYTATGGLSSSTGEFANVGAGVYTVRVRDNSPCEATVTVTVNNIDGVGLSDIELSESGCGTSNGSISVMAVDGTPPYEYALNSDPFQSEAVFNQLGAGEYTVRVRDSEDCETSQSVQVLTGISWDLDVSSIITNNCALPSCHGGTQSPDLREFQNVVNNAERIKTRTGNGTMPPNATLSDTEIQHIACWVDDGAPDN